MYESFGAASAENDHNCLNQDLNIQLQTPFGNVLCVKLYDFLEIRNITSTANVWPSSRDLPVCGR